MTGHADRPAAGRDSRSRAGTYVAVVVVEALVIAALYLFSRYFSA